MFVCLRERVYKSKANNKYVNFPYQFYLGSISNRFDYVEAEEVSLEGNDYNAIIMLLMNLSIKHSQEFNV